MHEGPISSQEWDEINARRAAETKEWRKAAKRKRCLDTLVAAISVVVTWLLSFALIWAESAVMLYIVCWAFDLTYSLRFVTGVWAILVLLKLTIIPSNNKK